MHIKFLGTICLQCYHIEISGHGVSGLVCSPELNLIYAEYSSNFKQHINSTVHFTDRQMHKFMHEHDSQINMLDQGCQSIR